MKIERREYMSKGAKFILEKSIETDEPRSWKLINSRLTAVVPP